MVEHQAFALHSHAILQQYTLNEHDRVLQFASFSFDTSLEQLFVAWLSGAGSVLMKSNLTATHDLSSFLHNHAITVMDLPPAYWQQMLDIETTAHKLPNLRILILGGEALPLSMARQTIKYFPALTCFNAYGPTEAVITPTMYRLPVMLSDKTTSVAIGRPRANTRIYILDANTNPSHPAFPVNCALQAQDSHAAISTVPNSPQKNSSKSNCSATPSAFTQPVIWRDGSPMAT